MEEPVGEDGLNAGQGERTPRLELFEWFDSVVYSIVAVVMLLSFVFRMIGVDGSSMVPTLQNTDRVLMVSAFYAPKRGDIVVFTKLRDPLVKRVIAVGGQTVDIDFESGEVYVDGVLQNEPYIAEPTLREGSTTFPLTVPEGHIFVMGDNRNHSSDSRVQEVGFVDTRYVIGRVLFRVFPLPSFGKIPYV
ncbi:MAG: signal peptidase I [Clostridiales bacterium]|nr:signal peptidase I [Clostridiales bacterium]